jgi:hypothetical protein
MVQRDIRRLLITGAMAVVRSALRHGAAEGSWLQRMLARKPRMLVAIALANKMARSLWAMLTKGQDFRVPAVAVARHMWNGPPGKHFLQTLHPAGTVRSYVRPFSAVIDRRP